MASLQLQLRQPTASGHCRCNNLGEVCVGYKYTNASLKQTATLYKFRGQIMFMGFGTPPTQWHGSFSEDSDGVVRLNFNCRGDVSRLHGATLFQTAPTRFSGLDYMHRIITTEYVCRYVCCERCGSWRTQAWARLVDRLDDNNAKRFTA